MHRAARRGRSNPPRPIWVTASAGTGKTRVLTSRVLRLMLAGVAPGKILCITFTKAAAAEMLDAHSRPAGRMGEAAGRHARRGSRNLLGAMPGRGGDDPRAAAVRAGAGCAGRPADPDHPFLLPVASGAVPAGGRHLALLLGDGRADGRGASGRRHRDGARRGAGRRRHGARLGDPRDLVACHGKRVSASWFPPSPASGGRSPGSSTGTAESRASRRRCIAVSASA